MLAGADTRMAGGGRYEGELLEAGQSCTRGIQGTHAGCREMLASLSCNGTVTVEVDIDVLLKRWCSGGGKKVTASAAPGVDRNGSDAAPPTNASVSQIVGYPGKPSY